MFQGINVFSFGLCEKQRVRISILDEEWIDKKGDIDIFFDKLSYNSSYTECPLTLDSSIVINKINKTFPRLLKEPAILQRIKEKQDDDEF